MSVRPHGKSELVQTVVAAAKALGIDTRTFRRWREEPWFPAAAHSAKGWNVSAIRRARDAAGRKGSALDERQQEMRSERDRQLTRKLKAAADLAELATLKATGEVLPRETVELHMATLFSSVVDFCKQLPRLVAGVVPLEHQPALVAKLNDELDQWRTRLRGDLMSAAQDLGQTVALNDSGMSSESTTSKENE